MAVFRMVQTSFWTDMKVVEEMTPEDRYGWLYLLTNPHTTQIGIYGLSARQMAFEMGYSTDTALSLIDRFENHLSLIKYDKETREIAVLNWGKYNLIKKGKPMIDCVKSELKKVKSPKLIEYILEGIQDPKYQELFIEAFTRLVNDSCNDTQTSPEVTEAVDLQTAVVRFEGHEDSSLTQEMTNRVKHLEIEESDDTLTSRSTTGGQEEEKEKEEEEYKNNKLSLSSDNPQTDSTINSKPTEKNYLALYEHYKSLDLVNHRKLSKSMKDSMRKALSGGNSVDDLKMCLERHEVIVKLTAKSQYSVKLRTIQEFFGQKVKEGTMLICEEYLDDGPKWLKHKDAVVNYERTGQIVRRTANAKPTSKGNFGQFGQRDKSSANRLMEASRKADRRDPIDTTKNLVR